MAITPEEYACLPHDGQNDQDKDGEVQVNVQSDDLRLSGNKTNAEHMIKG
jgi:hypothetical protein